MWQRHGEAGHTSTSSLPPGCQRQVPDTWWGILKTSGSNWLEHKDFKAGAALAHYSIFSIADTTSITTPPDGGQRPGQLPDTWRNEWAWAGLAATISTSRWRAGTVMAVFYGVLGQLLGVFFLPRTSHWRTQKLMGRHVQIDGR